MEESSSRTLGHYESRAAAFWEGTRDHDVNQNMDALHEAMQPEAKARVLDLGCGPGRDLKAWTDRGVEAVGLDGCPSFCAMARQHSGCEVWHQDFLALELPDEYFDGVFANASLFHVPSAHLGRVLSELFQTLRPGGVLFSSNPRGQGQEGWQGERYGVYHDLDGWTSWVTGAGFEPIRHYYRPTGKPREEQPWLASVWRRPS